MEEDLIKKWEVFDQLSVPVFIVNEKNLCIFANKYMQNVYGYTPEELINQNIFRLLFSLKTYKMSLVFWTIVF